MPVDIGDDATRRRVEDSLARIDGVEHVRIVASGSQITEVHVVARDVRPPKQVARDIVSALRAVHDVDVDHRKVSVATFGPKAGRSDPSPTRGKPFVSENGRGRGRICLSSISLRDSRSDVDVEVALVCGGREVSGRARGPAGGDRIARLMASATARAVGHLLDARYRVDTDDVRLVSFASRRAVLVTVTVGCNRERRELLGSAWIDDDVGGAAVHATLDAVNRVFGRLDRRKTTEYVVGPSSP